MSSPATEQSPPQLGLGARAAGVVIWSAFLAAAVATPTAASAAVECGLVVPKKLVIDANAVARGLLNTVLLDGGYAVAATTAASNRIASSGAARKRVHLRIAT